MHVDWKDTHKHTSSAPCIPAWMSDKREYAPVQGCVRFCGSGEAGMSKAVGVDLQSLGLVLQIEVSWLVSMLQVLLAPFMCLRVCVRVRVWACWPQLQFSAVQGVQQCGVGRRNH